MRKPYSAFVGGEVTFVMWNESTLTWGFQSPRAIDPLEQALRASSAFPQTQDDAKRLGAAQYVGAAE